MTLANRRNRVHISRDYKQIKMTKNQSFVLLNRSNRRDNSNLLLCEGDLNC